MCHWIIDRHQLRRFSLVALLLAGFSMRVMAADSSQATNFASLGRLILTPFATAPFPHPARADGHKYHDQFYSAAEHYADNTVAIFIPKHFRGTQALDFVVHFHGWNNSVAGTLSQYQLMEQFSASGKNAILIVPEGPHNAPDSFGGKLEDTNGFKAFLTEAMKKLQAAGMLKNAQAEIGSVIISGHSGGYHVMAGIVARGGVPIKEAWLFDALYGNTENFVAWQKNQNGRLLDIYTDHGGTKEETEKLMADYKTNNVSFVSLEETNGVPQDLPAGKIFFLHTDLTHNEVIFRREEFAQFLKTSCLQDK